MGTRVPGAGLRGEAFILLVVDAALRGPPRCCSRGRTRSLLETAQEAKQSVQQSQRMRRTAGHPQVHREIRRNPISDLRPAPKGASIDGAGSDRDDQSRFRRGFVGSLHRRPHVLAHRAADHNAIRVPRAGHKLDPEPGQVEHHVSQGNEFRFTSAAAPGGHRSKPQGAPEQASHPLVERLDQANVTVRRDQALALPARHAVVGRELDRAMRASGSLLGREEAGASVETRVTIGPLDEHGRGHGCPTSPTLVEAATGIE